MPDEPQTSPPTYSARLHGLLLQSFDTGDLRTLCLLVDVNYNLLIGEHMGQKATSLIETMVREKRLGDLITVCKEKFPAEQWDKTAEEEQLEAERAARRAEAAESSTESEIIHSTLSIVLPKGAEGESVERGLAALSELMNLPEARTAVINFRTDFEGVTSRIDVLADYKQVHDLLHVLESQCFASLQQAAKDFPADTQSVDIAMDAELTLQQTLDACKALMERPTFVTNELVWVQDLAKAQIALKEAVDKEDAEKLRNAQWLINRVVAIQPSQINTRLNEVARSLLLSALVSAMTRIHENLGTLAMDKDRLQEFVEGAYSLAKLDNNLTELVKAHDDWQAIMLEFRRIESSLVGDAEAMELKMSWPYLLPQLEPLYKTAATEEWSTALDEDCVRLGEAIAGNNPVRMNRFFHRLEQRCRNRFYVIDVDLRRLCEDLRRVGQPLAVILKLLE